MPQSTRELHLNRNRVETSASRPYRAMVWTQFKRDRLATCGLVLIVLLFAVALAAPLLAGNRPILMRLDGRLSAPLVRELFAPSDNPEAFLERVFNYALVLALALAIVLPPLRLFARKLWPARRSLMAWSALGIAAVCLLPFFIVKPRLDATDYREPDGRTVESVEVAFRSILWRYLEEQHGALAEEWSYIPAWRFPVVRLLVRGWNVVSADRIEVDTVFEMWAGAGPELEPSDMFKHPYGRSNEMAMTWQCIDNEWRLAETKPAFLRVEDTLPYRFYYQGW